MKTCNKCHVKKSERDFTKGKGICMKCRSNKQNEINKADRTHKKFINNLASKEERELFYNTVIKDNESFLTLKEFAEYKENPKYTILNCLDKKYPLFHKNNQTSWPDDFKKGLIKGVYEINATPYIWNYVYDPEMYREFMAT